MCTAPHPTSAIEYLIHFFSLRMGCASSRSLQPLTMSDEDAAIHSIMERGQKEDRGEAVRRLRKLSLKVRAQVTPATIQCSAVAYTFTRARMRRAGGVWALATRKIIRAH